MYHVFVEYDGCPDEKPIYSGTEEKCKAYLRINWRRFNKGKQTLSLVAPSGRAVSFILLIP